MTKTYSEQRQAAYFRAARELRTVACSVLDEVENEVELTSEATLSWAISVAKSTATKAQELENLGYEECIVNSRAEMTQYKSRERYSKAIDDFEARVKAIPGGVYRLGGAKREALR